MWVIYSLTALLILVPLLGSGYILTLDLVFTPLFPMPSVASSSYLLRLILHYASYVMAGDILEKFLFFLILVLSAAGAYGFFMEIVTDKTTKVSNSSTTLLAAYTSGLIYMLNPYTYDRFMAGQYNVLLGYALLPWFATALIRFISVPDKRRSTSLLLWALAISIVSIHSVGFMCLLVVGAFVCAVWSRRSDVTYLRRLYKHVLAIIALFLLGSSYWLIPLILGHSVTANEINNFGPSDRVAFSTLGGSVFGRIVDVLRLQGFWAESRGLYKLPQDVLGIWYVLIYIIWVLVIIGMISLLRSGKKSIIFIFGVSAIIAIVFATGTFNAFLADNIPFFVGYREPQKFVAMLGLTYAVFAGFGVSKIVELLKKNAARPLYIIGCVVLLLLPFAWAPTMLWGFDNQLTPVQYPAAWSTINKRLDADPNNFNVLFLPWHQYMYFSFAGRIIANPASQFFDKPTLVSNNPQFGGITPPPNATDAKINKILNTAKTSASLGNELKNLNIKYVILDQDDDYANYSYLNGQNDLKLVYTSATLDLFENLAVRS